jgi:hypothetical protein
MGIWVLTVMVVVVYPLLPPSLVNLFSKVTPLYTAFSRKIQS